MSHRRKLPDVPQFLSSWKEIANYLGKGVRTVQRYEVQFGLPIRRPAARSRASVVATRAEIDAWVAACPIRSEFRLARGGVASTSSSARESVHQAIREMHQLREQTADLRAEIRDALHLLMASLDTLRNEVSSQRRPSVSNQETSRAKESVRSALEIIEWPRSTQ